MNVVNNIIIGGGISGLLLAYNLIKMGHKILLLEGSDRLGGRIYHQYFHGLKIPMGAGIMRMSDHHGHKLCNDLNISFKQVNGTYNFVDTELNKINIDEIISTIKEKYSLHKKNKPESRISFGDFLDIYFDTNFVNKIKDLVAYNDCWLTDLEAVINDYPLEELFPANRSFYVIDGGWSNVIAKLIDFIDNDMIKLNQRVIKISNKTVWTSDNNTYEYSNRLFICADISIKNIDFSSFKNLDMDLMSRLDSIDAVPYFRMYNYFPRKHNILKTTYTGSIIDKIIPMNDLILMGSYSDGSNATRFNTLLENKVLNKQDLNEILNRSLGKDNLEIYFTDYTYHYWPIGVHYFYPGSINYKSKSFGVSSDKKLWIIGEMLSHNQGWVEGAIESVNSAIEFI